MPSEINVSGRMKVKTLKDQFFNEFGLVLRVYKGIKFADDDATLASCRKDGADAKGGEVKIWNKSKIGNIEKQFMENFGVKVNIASGDNSKLLDDKLIVNDAAKEFGAKKK